MPENTTPSHAPGEGDAGLPPTVVPETQVSQTPAIPPYTAPLPTTPGRLGRYEVYEEIARGGMGSVLRARDPELKRDLAIKVLRLGLAGHPEMVRRFVEEAQITAQLPHPGVVPVHDVGRDISGLPFLVMKLVRGETLEALLARRATPGEDLPRFVAIFEQVCQAVAFAHSRRVLHRDLKPSNVMVGAFGEVQVMDWGLAKVLTPAGPAPARQAGDEVETLRRGGPDTQGVLGTPSYMPPEQAGGQWGRVDERADVFGLGAILCEVLTGRPPYGGASAEEVLDLARRGDLAAAHARLDGCGADGELVTLAKECLSANRDGRPRDAGAVAQRVAEYRAGVEQRLRQAEGERAAAEARAQEERKRRRLAVALAALVVVLVAGGGAAWWWYQQDRQRREGERAARRAGDEAEVRSALDEVERLRDEGRARVDDAGRWGAILATARAALHRAEEVAGRNEVGEELAARARQAHQELDDDGADWRLAAGLERVRLEYADALGKPASAAAAAAGYRKLFAAHGPGSEVIPRDDLVGRLRAHRLRTLLLAALGDWAWITPDRREKQEVEALEEAVARGSEPWRTRLRTALRQQDTRALGQLADGAEARGLPPAALADLGRRLRAARASEAAERLLRDGLRRHPDDFWLNHELGIAYYQASPPRPEEAVRYLTVAVALRGDSAPAHVNLGGALKARGDLEEAVRCYRRAAELDPALAAAPYNLGLALYAKGDMAGAADCFRSASRLDPDNAWAPNNLGSALLAQGNAEGAADCFRKALKLDPEHAFAHYNLGTVLFQKGDMDGAVVHLRRAVANDPGIAQAQNNLANALYALGEVKEAIRCYRKAIELDPEYATAYSNLGAALREQGDTVGAARYLRKVVDLRPKDATAHYALGVALLAGEDYAAARDATRRSLGLLPEQDALRGPATQQLRQCETALALGEKLPEVLQGKVRPAGADEAIHLALLCQEYLRRYAAAARLFTDAFAAKPNLAADMKAQHRYNAACAAALAAAGKGTDADQLGPGDRAALRRQALGWLRADLNAMAQCLADTKPPQQQAILQALRRWQHDTDLTGVRDKKALADLPAVEGDAWKKLWADVADLIRKADEKK